MLRTPKASDGQGGAIGEAEALKRGNSVGIRDQIMDLAAENGLLVTRADRNDSEILLPTPTTIDAKNVDVANQMETRHSPGLHAITGLLGMPIETWETTGQTELLPTTTAHDAKDGTQPRVRDGEIQTDSLSRLLFNSDEVELLPTVRVSSANGSTKKERDAGNPKRRLETEAEMNDATRWGKFAPAIERWEKVLGRPAPAPTKPDGKDDAHRLSSLFTEWLMGLPENWVTGAGLKRAEELKACGNGVVPQQAALALQVILAEIDEIKENNFRMDKEGAN